MSLAIIDYSNTVFYKIYCNDATVSDIYVGHTTDFVQRKYTHKRACIKVKDASHHFKVYKFIREHGGWENWKMDIMGFHHCYDHYEARKIEQNYFETLQATLNSIEPLPKPRPTTVPKVKQEKRVWHCDVCQTTCQTNKALIAHEETTKHKRNSVINASTNNCEQKVTQKIAKTFNCDNCNYKCSNKYDYNKHLLTAKHKTIITKQAENNKSHKCMCGKNFMHISGLSRHKKKCNERDDSNTSTSVVETVNSNTCVMELTAQIKELMNIIVVQNQENKELMNIIVVQNQENKELMNIIGAGTPP